MQYNLFVSSLGITFPLTDKIWSKRNSLLAKVIIGSANNDKEENANPPKITNNLKLFFTDL